MKTICQSLLVVTFFWVIFSKVAFSYFLSDFSINNTFAELEHAERFFKDPYEVKIIRGLIEQKYQELYSSTPNINWDINDLELWLQGPDKTEEEKVLVNQLLVKKYLYEDRMQEAIWTYRHMGMNKKAKEIEEQLLARLMDPNLKLEFAQAYSANRGYITKYKEDAGILEVIFRYGNSNFIHEVLAYKLDRLLELNLIPMTVLRELPDEGYGSLQYYVRGSSSSCILYRGEGNFLEGYYPHRLQKLWLLDYLLDNKDRHEDNWRKRFGNIPFAFDHEQILGNGNGFGSPKLYDSILPSGDLLDRLRSLKPEDFKDFKDSNVDIKFIFRKRGEILERVEKATSTSSNHCLTAITQFIVQ